MIPVFWFVCPLVEELLPRYAEEELQRAEAAAREGFKVLNLRPSLWPEPQLTALRVSTADHHPNAAGYALLVDTLLHSPGCHPFQQELATRFSAVPCQIPSQEDAGISGR